MTTLDDVAQMQKDCAILTAPTIVPSSEAAPPPVSITGRTNSTLSVALTNTTGSSNVYAYITGLAIDNNYAVCLLESDGQTVYYPTSPANNGTPLAVNCGIPLTGVGTTQTVTIPQLAAARVWFSIGQPLTFLLNPGPGLVEPSVTNTSDPNYNIVWDFCEFTYNSAQLFVNITMVDFVSLPISLSVTDTSGHVQNVPGLPSNGLSSVVSGVQAQDAVDGAGWSKLIVTSPSGNTLRVLSPNSAITMQPSLFQGYWQSYVNSVWSKYSSSSLVIDTQAQWGVVTGTVTDGALTIADVGAIPQPSAADIFSCSSGAFAAPPTNTAEMNNICARVAAAFNRSTLLLDASQPDGETVASYYTAPVTNHYARVCHATTIDGRGYAFPYDDVGNASEADQTGAISEGAPAMLTVTVGGGDATTRRAVRAGDMARRAGQMPGGRKQHSAPAGRRLGRRDFGWGAEEERAALVAADEAGAAASVPEMVQDKAAVAAMTDLEKGEALGTPAGTPAAAGGRLAQVMSQPLRSLVPSALVRRAEAWMQELEAHPIYAYTKPVLDVLTRLLLAVLSLSVRTVLGRLSMVLACVLFALLVGLYGHIRGQAPSS